MKLLDQKSLIFFNNVFLYLTKQEASDIAKEMKKLLEDPQCSEVVIMGEDVNGEFTKKIVIKLEDE